MFSRGQILLEIHDAIAMRTQTWVGKNVMLSRGQILFNIHNAIAMLTQIWVGKNSQCFHEVSLGPIVIRWFKTKGRVRLSYTYLVIVQLYQGSGDHLGPTWTPKWTMQG